MESVFGIEGFNIGYYFFVDVVIKDLFKFLDMMGKVVMLMFEMGEEKMEVIGVIGVVGIFDLILNWEFCYWFVIELELVMLCYSV